MNRLSISRFLSPGTLFRVRLIVFCTACVFSVNGCYLLRQGVQLIRYQVRSEPVAAMLQDSTLPVQQRRFFEEVERIRAYAVDSIGLARNKNYTRFVAVDSSYLMAMLSAADSASFTTKKWCYPFMGCFPLRSYYEIDDARRAGRRLAEEGYEINIDKIDGFSTLGIFTDPLYSFMADQSVYAVAQYVFHELTHATAYFKNVQFSEELATFIGREGALRYLKTYYGETSPEYETARKLIADGDVYLGLLRDLYGKLETVYGEPTGRSEKLRRKKEIIDRLRRRLSDDYDSLFSTQAYRGIEKLTFNNAFLAVRMTYHLDLELFARFHRLHGYRLRELVGFAVQCKKKKEDPKELLEKATGR